MENELNAEALNLKKKVAKMGKNVVMPEKCCDELENSLRARNKCVAVAVRSKIALEAELVSLKR